MVCTMRLIPKIDRDRHDIIKSENISVEFQTNDGAVQAVNDLNFELEKGIP